MTDGGSGMEVKSIENHSVALDHHVANSLIDRAKSGNSNSRDDVLRFDMDPDLKSCDSMIRTRKSIGGVARVSSNFINNHHHDEDDLGEGGGGVTKYKLPKFVIPCHLNGDGGNDGCIAEDRVVRSNGAELVFEGGRSGLIEERPGTVMSAIINTKSCDNNNKSNICGDGIEPNKNCDRHLLGDIRRNDRAAALPSSYSNLTYYPADPSPNSLYDPSSIWDDEPKDYFKSDHKDDVDNVKNCALSSATTANLSNETDVHSHEIRSGENLLPQEKLLVHQGNGHVGLTKPISQIIISYASDSNHDFPVHRKSYGTSVVEGGVGDVPNIPESSEPPLSQVGNLESDHQEVKNRVRKNGVFGSSNNNNSNSIDSRTESIEPDFKVNEPNDSLIVGIKSESSKKKLGSFLRKRFAKISLRKLIFKKSDRDCDSIRRSTRICCKDISFYYPYASKFLRLFVLILTVLYKHTRNLSHSGTNILTELVSSLYERVFPTMEFYIQKLGERFKTMDKRELQGKVLNLVDETVDNFGGRKLAEEAQKNLKKRKRLYYRLKRQLFQYLNRPLAQTEAEVVEDARIYCRDYIHDRLKRSGIVISLKHLPVGPPSEISRQIQSMGLYLEAMYPLLFCNIDAQLSGSYGPNGQTRTNFLTIERVTYLLSRLAHNLYRPDPPPAGTDATTSGAVNASEQGSSGSGSLEAPAVIRNAQIYCYTSSGNSHNPNSPSDDGLRQRRFQQNFNTEATGLSNGHVSQRMDAQIAPQTRTEDGVLGSNNTGTDPPSSVTVIPGSPDTITWGTIVALFALAGAFSVSSVLQGRLEFLPVITEKVTTIFKEELAPWIAAQPGGWVALITQYKLKEQTNYKKWQIVLGTLIALAFTVLALETIPNIDEFHHKLGNHTYIFFD